MLTGFSRLAVVLFIQWILACCVQGLGAKGCAFLAVVCKRYPTSCDREVLHKRCAHYPEALDFVRKQSYDSVPPVNPVKQWPNFPYSMYGPYGRIEKKKHHQQDYVREYEDIKNQYVKEYERLLRKRERLDKLKEESKYDSWEEYFDHDLHDKRNDLNKKRFRFDIDHKELNHVNTQDYGVIKPEDRTIGSKVDQYHDVNNDVDKTGGFQRSNFHSDDADYHNTNKNLDVVQNKQKKVTGKVNAEEFLENQVEQRAIILANEKHHVDSNPDSELDFKNNFNIKSGRKEKNTERSEETNVLDSKRTVEEDIDVDAALNKANSANSNIQVKDVTHNVEVKSNAENSGNSIGFDDKSVIGDKKSIGPSEKSNDPQSEDKGILVIKTSTGTTLSNSQAEILGNTIQQGLWGVDSKKHKVFKSIKVHGNNVRLHMVTDSSWFSSNDNAKAAASKINQDKTIISGLSKSIGITVVSASSSMTPSEQSAPYWFPKDKGWDKFAIITAIVGGTTLGLIVASVLICTIKRSKRKKHIEVDKQEAVSDYQELCRTQMAVNSGSPDSLKSMHADRQRHGLINGHGKVTRRTWGEEPVSYNMDISTGHVVLSYLESHLKNEDRLSKEWEALCNYRAERDATTVGSDQKNPNKNRYKDVLPYDHTRVKLKETMNVTQSDYINASIITDADPKNPAYLATQGPLETTVSDFWQMIWEQGIVVIVNLTRLSDLGLPQCHRYWPEEGSEVYHIYEVHLISEHIWCEDYLVRSFYLKNLQTGETRTVTQFHFLAWPDLSVPENSKPLLEFRRKVNKCYRGQSCPIVVHCSNGVGRTGTYILIDMVLNKMIKGTKEIDIAATLEHLRDQRPDMVKTKAQFEFVLAAVAEEVTAILNSLPSQ